MNNNNNNNNNNNKYNSKNNNNKYNSKTNDDKTYIKIFTVKRIERFNFKVKKFKLLINSNCWRYDEHSKQKTKTTTATVC